ncbi:amidohydrolase [Chitinophaga oryziterrae]|uniref:Amidohydrolase n=1 Tax=Chitinophaga oryziterrae TaxID=1031224 RepID=A0A6N8J4W3_9BACT|nr:amidohydrolase [Chitinophaga oryziterrae]MVT39212.1 amidohydrolase [Chitinophaga oryziterrae]
MRQFILPVLCCLSSLTIAQNKDKAALISYLDQHTSEYDTIAKKIWGFAEVGYQEQKSSALLQATLEQQGFTVKAGIAGIPTAFMASYGSGEPVIGILAEYDALPGLSQTEDPEQKAIIDGGAGHGCGHNLFGTASVAAAISIKEWLKKSGGKGTVRLYGCPAEEGGSGKVYMVRAGLFNDVSAVLHWHPGNDNSAAIFPWLSNKNAKFRFYGVASHAAGAPEKGRSALDAVEAMDYMVNMMREHVPQETRIHYVITKGGDAPNVVPAFAEVYYYVRHPDMQVVKDIWERMVKAAEGAAMGTGTRMDYEVIGGVYNMLPNETLSKLMDANLHTVGGFTYTASEREFAKKIQSTLIDKTHLPDLDKATATIQPFKMEKEGGIGSSDVADVSWVAPTAGLSTATFVPGSGGHSWQNVAAAGSTIGAKGMMVAAKTLALTAYDLFNSPASLTAAKQELKQRQGPGFKYEAMLGNRAPALDYRKK